VLENQRRRVQTRCAYTSSHVKSLLTSSDGHDLPPALRDWLYPTDGTTRDFASLQVVFGRGEEYFASDKHGKMEYKEPDVKKLTPGEDEEKLDKQALRRSRTVSFLRPLSVTSVRSDSSAMESNRSKRSSSISSQRASRPPSLSYTTSRTNSEVSILGDTIVEGQTSQPRRPSVISYPMPLDSPAAETSLPPSPQKPAVELTKAMTPHPESVPLLESPVQAIREIAAYDLQAMPVPDPTPPQELPMVPKDTANTSPCTCGCHDPPLFSHPQTKSSYANASTQTDRISSPPRTALRIDTSAPSYWPSQYGYSAVSQDPYYSDHDTPPVFTGRMMNYFSKPGYQLGDSLFSGYQPIDWQHGTYEYQDEFGEEALR
jgi:hypothetical protein